jgi:IS5 family transposase
MPIETMLRIYFVQQWFDLSDPAAEDALYDIQSIRRFVGLDMSSDALPDESTILRFRHMLERHELTAAMFTTVRVLLERNRILLKSGTIVDGTIISAPLSTKNSTGTRGPRDGADPQGKPVVLRDQGARRHGQERSGAFAQDDGRGSSGHQPRVGPASW